MQAQARGSHSAVGRKVHIEARGRDTPTAAGDDARSLKQAREECKEGAAGHSRWRLYLCQACHVAAPKAENLQDVVERDVAPAARENGTAGVWMVAKEGAL